MAFTPDASLAGGDWTGVITKGATAAGTNRGILHLTDSFRSVTKISFYRRGGAIGKWFIGFVQDDAGGPDPSVGDPLTGVTLISGLAPAYSVIGLAIDQEVDTNIYFWTRGAGGDFFVPTGQTIGNIFPAGTTDAFYFVVETRYDKTLYVPPGSLAPSGGVEVRLGLYNSKMEQLAGTVVTDLDRLPMLVGAGGGLFYAAGVRVPDASPTAATLNFHGTSLVLDSWKPRIGPIQARP